MISLHLLGGVRIQSDAERLSGRIAQRHRLALLALLAGHRGGVSRDKLVGFLWPERDSTHARNLLSQAVHAVRAELGGEVLLSEGSALRLDPLRLRADVWAFEEALQREAWEAATRLYVGAFLDGFFLPGAYEFEEWVSQERGRLARAYGAALERLAEARESCDDLLRSVEAWRTLAAHDPLSSRVALRLMRTLEDLGDPAAALQHGIAHQARLREELGVEPDPEVQAKMDQLRALRLPEATAPRPAPSDQERIEQPPQPLVPQSPMRRRWAIAPGIAAVAAALAVVTVVSVRQVVEPAEALVGTATSPLRPPDESSPTRSALAYSLYRKGLEELQERHGMDAYTLFAAALAEDSTFAMAAYYAFAAGGAPGENNAWDYLARAERLADRAPDRDRLYIRLQAALIRDSLPALAFADTLLARFPDDPEAHVAAGEVLSEAGDFPGAIAHLRAALAMDSAKWSGDLVPCVCTALNRLAGTYLLADSSAAGLEVARSTVERWPRSVAAWTGLAWALQVSGRYEEARAAWARVAHLDPTTSTPIIEGSDVAIRAGDFETADIVLSGRAASSPRLEAEGLWYEAISLRYQGRLRKALDAAQRVRRSAPGDTESRWPPLEAMAEAAVLFDMRRFHEAAALYDSLAAGVYGGARDADLDAKEARGRAWRLTLAASARAAAGDTAGLRAVADRVRVLGARSLYGRDRLLYHHILGLIHVAAGDDGAAEAEFRQAISSPTSGYTRANLELARVLMRQNRPREAVPFLRAALAGSLEASNMYVTHTELRELLGEAYEAAEEPDSAAVQYRWVLHAWEHADPVFADRRAEVRRRLDEVRAQPAAPASSAHSSSGGDAPPTSPLQRSSQVQAGIEGRRCLVSALTERA